MLIQVVDSSGENVLLYEVHGSYNLEEAEELIRGAYQTAKEKEDSVDEFEEDFYIHDEVESKLPLGFTRVFTEIMTCDLF